MTTAFPYHYRRLLVVAFIGGTLGGLVVRTFFPQLDALAKALQIVGPISGAFLFGMGRSQLASRELDERQQQVRYEVYLRSFLLVAAVVVVVPVVVTIVYLVSEPTVGHLIEKQLSAWQRPLDFVMALVALVPLVGLLPWAMLAWLEAGPLDEDQ
ncbi:MAG TPA: hypothetical protein VFN03_03535 [Trueperaceae bacterium]|nr:hypothetical protein [Trueperaceae bacterium]